MEKTAAKTARAQSASFEGGKVVLAVDGENTLEGANITVTFDPNAFLFLAKGTPEQLANVRILQEGHLLHWPDLDAELPVVRLLEKLFGLTDATSTGRLGGLKGGTVKSTAKSEAARANGAKGGRPRTKPAPDAE